MAKLVSGTYGEALFELASEKNTVSAMLEEVSGLQMVLKENKELSVLMNNPKVQRQSGPSLYTKTEIEKLLSITMITTLLLVLLQMMVLLICSTDMKKGLIQSKN